jgi:hypothetical protein
MIKFIPIPFHLPFKTKNGRGDAPVLAPLSQIKKHFLYGENPPNAGKIYDHEIYIKSSS